MNRSDPYFGEFVLFDEIGRGGMGVVYDAQQTKLDRPVALKILHPGLIGAEAGFQRLRLEAETTARLEHPNIVPIFEVGEHKGQPYLAMQRINGESLAERIAQDGPISSEKAAAALVAKIARAVHHAHERGVLHRDLKPGNILMDEQGEPHLIDFGLAKWLGGDSGLTQTGAILGTPAYLSPEQAAGQNESVTISSDVYGLGAILYALLTGRPPFLGDSAATTIEQVRKGGPARVRSVRPTLAADLETICLKCLEKEPSRRYPTALALAEDLDRFVDGWPIMARVAGVPERVWMWARRNPAYAALWGMTLLMGLLGMAIPLSNARRESSVRRREALIQGALVLRMKPHAEGWSRDALANLRQAAAERPDDRIRTEALATLAGLDMNHGDAAREGVSNYGADHLAFDEQGGRLLMDGGLYSNRARLWNTKTRKLTEFANSGRGPVWFARDGNPRLMRAIRAGAFEIINPADGRQLSKLALAPGPFLDGAGNDLVFAVSPDGSLVAAAAHLSASNSPSGATALCRLGVWNVETGEMIQAGTEACTAFAFSPDDHCLAIGDHRGGVQVRSLPGWACGARFTNDDVDVNCLAFGRNPRLTPNQDTSKAWLLAVGDAGGTIWIHDLTGQAAKIPCRGSSHEVFDVAFAPDGMTLISSGRNPGSLRFWDIATGRELLQAGGDDFARAIACSPDGRKLAVGCGPGFGAFKGSVNLRAIEYDRGVIFLRGLVSACNKVAFSPDGRRLAGLAANWQVGIWDLASNRLVCVLRAPPGVSADNAALCFSRDGELLAFATSGAARLWRSTSGEVEGSWEPPHGLQQTLWFDDAHRLWLYQWDSVSGNTNGECHVRNLSPPDRVEPLHSLPFFQGRPFCTAVSDDGHVLAIGGSSYPSNFLTHVLKVLDPKTGKELRPLLAHGTKDDDSFAMDSSGRLLACRGFKDETMDIYEILTDHEPSNYARPIMALSRDGLWMANTPSPADLLGVRIWRQAAPDRSVMIGVGLSCASSGGVVFSRDGTSIAWGATDGTVVVCQMARVTERLEQEGMGWQ
jgi:WD40 repeat protein